MIPSLAMYGLPAAEWEQAEEVKPAEPVPEIPAECWHRDGDFDPERAHRATLLACRGQ